MRIGSKLLLSFLSVALLVLITGSISYYFSNEIKNDLILESRTTSVQMQTLTEMSSQLQNSLLYTRNYLTESAKQRAGNNSLPVAAQIRQSREIVLTSLQRFSEELDKISVNELNDFSDTESVGINQSEITELTDSLRQSYSYYKTLVMELFELDETTMLSEEVFNITIEPYFRNTLLPILLELRSTYNESVELRLSNLQDRAEKTLWNIIFYSTFAFIISLVLAYLVYRSITIPVKKLTKTAQALGDGNLSERIELNTKDELENLANTFNKMAENLNKSMVSRSYVNNIIQSMGDMLLVTNAEDEIVLANDAVSKKLGFESDDIINSSFWHIVVGEEREDVKAIVENAVKMESPAETRFVSKNGEVIPVNLSYSTLADQEENMGRIFVASDISLLKEAEKKISDSLNEKNVLLAEIHHRVKNNLAVISGLLEMQIWNLKNPESINILRDSQLRIQSIALVHEKLYQTDDFADVHIREYVEELSKGIEESFRDPGKKIVRSIECDDIRMNINQAIPFSLLLNEAVVNAYKHAFKGLDEGVIKITLLQRNNELRLTVSDDGIGLPDNKPNPDKPSQGMKLIDTLSKQLDGNYKLKPGPDKGTVFEVTFPI